MIDLVVNPASKAFLKKLLDNLPQALLLTGPQGVGLSTIGRSIAEDRGVIPSVVLPEKQEKVDLENGKITVASIRRLYDETRTKITGSRVIIIDYAERMTLQSQNAFLKLLEEPGEGTYFILIAHSDATLLPTILSRMQRANILPATHEQSGALLDSLGVIDATKRTRMLFMADGLPAELTRLASDEDYFNTRIDSVRDAREFLQGTSYQKLLIAQKYKDNRQAAITLLIDASNILYRSIVEQHKTDVLPRVDAILVALQQIRANGNIRLCLARSAL